MLHIGLAIALLVLCGSYKDYPTLSKRTGINVITIILTVLTGIKALAVLFGVIPSYYGTESDIPYSGLSVFSSVMFATIVIYYGGVITLSVIACIKGYKCMSNNELTSAFRSATLGRKGTADIPHTVCRKCSAELYNRKQRMAVQKLW